MKLNLLDNQIDLILDSLQAYTKVSDKHQLIYATYESILSQKTEKQVKSTNTNDLKLVTNL